MANTKKYVSLDKLSLYDEKIKKYLADADTATLNSAKAYSDSKDSQFDVAGAAATAEANAKAYADGKDTAIAEAKKAGTDAQAAAEAADTKAVAAQGEVDALEGVVANLDAYVGDIPEGYTEETVIAYINKKAEETLNAASGGSSESAASVLAALNTYKAENDPKVAKNTEDIATAQAAADQAKEDAAKVATDLATEITNRTNADDALDGRIQTLEGQITGLSGAMHFKGVVETDPTTITTGYENGDTVIYGNKEYVFNNGAFVEFGDVSAQAEAITTLTGRVSTAEGKITTAEGKITTLEGAVDTKAEQTALDEAVEALEGVDAGQETRIAALEAKFGGAEGSVEDMIADAKAEAIATAGTNANTKDATVLTNANKYTDEEIDKVEATISTMQTAIDGKAAAADLTALTGRVTTAEGEIDTLQSEMDAVEAKALANEGAISTLNTTVAGKAAQSDLTAATDRITAIETWHSNFVEVSEEEINALFTTTA